MMDFIKYMELRPLLIEAADIISTNFASAINSCGTLAEEHKDKSHIYNAIHKQLIEVDYAAALRHAQELEKERLTVQANSKREKEEEDRRKRTTERIIKNKAELDKKKAAEEAEAKAGHPLSVDPNVIMRMLQHVGQQLAGLYSNGEITSDYASAIQHMIMDIKSATRRKSATPSSFQSDVDKRRDLMHKQWIGKGHSSTLYRGGMEIAKLLREKGLPDSVTDIDAASSYVKIHNLLMSMHQNAKSHGYHHENYMRNVMTHWINNGEIGDEYASEEEIEVMKAMLRVGSLKNPTTYTHVPTPPPAAPTASPTATPTPSPTPSPTPTPTADDDDIMNKKDDSDDLHQQGVPTEKDTKTLIKNVIHSFVKTKGMDDDIENVASAILIKLSNYQSKSKSNKINKTIIRKLVNDIVEPPESRQAGKSTIPGVDDAANNIRKIMNKSSEIKKMAAAIVKAIEHEYVNENIKNEYFIIMKKLAGIKS